jgi:PKD repeat protein
MNASFILPTPAPYTQAVAFDASASEGIGALAYAWTITGPEGYSRTGKGRVLWWGFPTPGAYTITLTVTDATGATDSVSQTYTPGPGQLTRTGYGLTDRVRFTSPAVTDELAPGWTHHHGHWARAPIGQHNRYFGPAIALGPHTAAFGVQLKCWPQADGTGVGIRLADGTQIVSGLVGDVWQERILSPGHVVLHQSAGGTYDLLHYIVVTHDGSMLTVRFQDGSAHEREVSIPHTGGPGIVRACVVALTPYPYIEGSIADAITWTGAPAPLVVSSMTAGHTAQAEDDAQVAASPAGTASLPRTHRRPFADRVRVWRGDTLHALIERAYPDRVVEDDTPPAKPTVTLVEAQPFALRLGRTPGVGGGSIQESRWQVTSQADTEFATPIADSGWMAASQYLASGLTQTTTYRARVRVRNEYGVSAWSDVELFSTISSVPVPAKPTIVLNRRTATSLRWDYALGAGGGTPTQVRYELALDADAAFAAPIRVSGWVPLGRWDATGLDPSTAYRARVQMGNGGGESEWSDGVQATTLAAGVAEAPLFSLFQRGTSNSRFAATHQGSTAHSATQYQVTLATDPTFLSPIATTGWITATSATGFTPTTTHYWLQGHEPLVQYLLRARVRATTSDTTASDWTATDFLGTPVLDGEVARYCVDTPGAQDLDANGGVIRWRDELGWAPALAQSTEARRPLLTGGGVFLDGVDDLLETGNLPEFFNNVFPFSRAWFQMIVAEFPSGSSSTNRLACVGGVGFMIQKAATTAQGTVDANWHVTLQNMPRGDGLTRAVWTWRRNTISPRQAIGSPGYTTVTAANADLASGAAGAFQLGSNGLAGVSCRAIVRAWIIWNRIPTEAELNALLAEAQQRWGATSQGAPT